MIQMRKYLLLFGLGPVFLLGCSSNDLPSTGIEPEPGTGTSEVPIQIETHVASTRAGLSVQNTEFDKGAQVNVFLSEATTGTPSTRYTQPMTYVTTNYAGAMSPSNSIFPYYPANGNDVNLWACYPSTVNQNTTTFTVMGNQTDNSNYKKSDLMYCKEENIARQKTVVPITFYHKMAKVQIYLSVPAGKDASVLNNSTVTITNVMRTIAINPSAQTIGTTTADLSNKGNIVVTYNGALNSAAIIVPQTVDPDYFLEIRLGNGDVLNYMLPQSIEFKSGTVNTFQISVNEQVIKATYTVHPWNDAPDINADVSLDA